MRRKPGSVRFDPYYKVQLWEPRSLSWMDVQRKHDSAEEARAAFPAGQRCRVMEITMEGRRPLDEGAAA